MAVVHPPLPLARPEPEEAVLGLPLPGPPGLPGSPPLLPQGLPPPPPLELAEELPPQPLELFVQEPPLPMPPEETLQLLRVEVRHLQHLVRQNARRSHQTLVPLRVPLPLLLPRVPLLLVPRRVQDDEILPPQHQFPLYRGRDQDAGEEQTLLVLVQEQWEQEYRVSADASGETLGELVQLR